jgi:signal peptidase I
MRRSVLVGAALALFVGLLCLRAFVIEAFKIPAGSMIPTLQVGDHIFADKLATHPKRGDVIVFIYPREPDKIFIKRVIAVGGDTVEWRGEVPVINGKPIPRAPVEGECKYDDLDYATDRWEERTCRAFEETLEGRIWRVIQDPYSRDMGWKPVTVPANSFYVLGDNRDNSHDSRFWGFVPAENVKGTATRVWFSSGKTMRTGRIGHKVQ